jgi:hypothetical protein
MGSAERVRSACPNKRPCSVRSFGVHQMFGSLHCSSDDVRISKVSSSKIERLYCVDHNIQLNAKLACDDKNCGLDAEGNPCKLI